MPRKTRGRSCLGDLGPGPELGMQVTVTDRSRSRLAAPKPSAVRTLGLWNARCRSRSRTGSPNARAQPKTRRTVKPEAWQRCSLDFARCWRSSTPYTAPWPPNELSAVLDADAERWGKLRLKTSRDLFPPRPERRCRVRGRDSTSGSPDRGQPTCWPAHESQTRGVVRGALLRRRRTRRRRPDARLGHRDACPVGGRKSAARPDGARAGGPLGCFGRVCPRVTGRPCGVVRESKLPRLALRAPCSRLMRAAERPRGDRRAAGR